MHGRHADEVDLRAREREQERDRVVVPGVAVEDDGRRHRGSIASTSAAVGSDGWAPKRDAASAPAAQARRSASSALASLEQRDEQAGRERVAGGRAVDRVDGRRLARATSSPSSSSTAPSAPSVTRDEPVAAPQRLELVAVDDGQVGVDVDGRAGAALRQKSPVACSQALRTASSGISSWRGRRRSARARPASSAFAPGATAIWFSPLASTRISATPVGASTRAAPRASAAPRAAAPRRRTRRRRPRRRA